MSIWTPPTAFPNDFTANGPAAATLLDALRLAAATLGSAAQFDEARLRGLLGQSRSSLARTHALALVAGLMRGMECTPVFHPAADPDQSFDESWVLRLVERASQNDADSVSFLLSRRVAAPARETVSLLLAALVSQMALDDRLRSGTQTH